MAEATPPDWFFDRKSQSAPKLNRVGSNWAQHNWKNKMTAPNDFTIRIFSPLQPNKIIKKTLKLMDFI
jgi:hypothetical protein